MPDPNERIIFTLFDYTVKSFKVRPGFALYGDIQPLDAAAAARLLVESQRTGYALKITAQVIKVADDNF